VGSAITARNACRPTRSRKADKQSRIYGFYSTALEVAFYPEGHFGIPEPAGTRARTSSKWLCIRRDTLVSTVAVGEVPQVKLEVALHPEGHFGGNSHICRAHCVSNWFYNVEGRFDHAVKSNCATVARLEVEFAIRESLWGGKRY